MGFANTFLEQFNNPECSMLSGMFAGEVMTSKVIFYLAVSYALIKIVDKLAFDPLLTWIKNKVYKRHAR